MANTTQLTGEEGLNKPTNHTNDEDFSTSGEYSDEEFSAEFDTFPIVLAIFIIAVNLTVIIVFIRQHSLRTVTNSFLASLAASDLLAGLAGIPLTICCTAVDNNTFCPISLLIWRFISISTVLHILLVSVDRYIAITHAMRYHNIVTRTVFFALTSLAWSTAAFISLIQLSWRVDARMDEDDEEHVNTAQITYDLSVFGLFFALPLFVMAYIYARIFITVRYHEKQIWRYHSPSEPEHSRHGKSNSHYSAQRKTATIFLAMLIVFVACWLPYFILSVQEQLTSEEFLPPAWVQYVFYYYARFFTSLANPLLYILGKRDFREALLSMLCKKESKARSESRASTTLTALFTVEQSANSDSRKPSAY